MSFCVSCDLNEHHFVVGTASSGEAAALAEMLTDQGASEVEIVEIAGD